MFAILTELNPIVRAYKKERAQFWVALLKPKYVSPLNVNDLILDARPELLPLWNVLI